MIEVKPHIEQRKLSDLVPAKYNPRNISDDALKGLAASMERFGVVEPIVWNKRTGNVVGGHQRLRVLQQANAKTAPVVVVDLDDVEERALNVTLNNPHIAGEFTDDLRGLLEGLEVDLPEFEDLQLDALLAELGVAPPPPAIDAADPRDADDDLAATWGTARGQTWALGDHLLRCGDSTDRGDADVFGEGAAACWTDPPYGVSYVGKTKDALTIANDDADGLDALLRASFANVDRALAPGGRIYVAHPAGARSVQFGLAFLGAGWRLHQTLVWRKDVMVLGHSDYHYQHEPILYGYKPGDGRWGRGGEGWYGDNAQVSVFDVPRPSRSELHPTMKPVALIESMLRNSTRRGDVVVEPFCGSGSTLLACELLGLRCRALEIDPRFAAVVLQRWVDSGGAAPTKIG